MERNETTQVPSGADGTAGAASAFAAAAQGCSCSEARAHLEAFLDHECEADLDARLTEHVRTCPHCSRVADAERHLRAILRSRCAEQAPDSLRERVLAKLSGIRCGQGDLELEPASADDASGGQARITRVESLTQVSTADGVVTRYSSTTRYTA